MMPAAKHGDPQLGVDVHLCTVPPSPSPVPLPTPHMSIVFDPMDYVPFFGATVTVCGMKRAVAGTSGRAVHIPPGFPFAPKLPDTEDELFMGSATVEADGDPFSFLGVPVLSCQVAGMASPPRPKRKGGPRTMMLPTVFNLAIPTNVFIGGPPTVSLLGMASKLGFAGLGKLGKSKFGQALGERFRDWRKARFGHLNPGFLRCKVLRAEPVNIATGEVVLDQEDFVLPGPLPLRWTRRYASGRRRRGACGHGWESPADARLEVDPQAGVVAFHHPEMGTALFDGLPEAAGDAGAVLEFMDGARLVDTGGEWQVRTKDGRTYHFPQHPSRIGNRPAGQEFPLGSVTDRRGNALRFERDGARLVAIHDAATGQRVEVESGADGTVRSLSLRVPGKAARHVFVRYAYDANGDLVEACDALRQPCRFVYEQHRMVRHADRNSLSFHYAYDWSGESWRAIHAWGDGGLLDYRFAYFDAARETRITDSLGQVWTVTFDGRGLPIRELDPLGGAIIFEYDAAGRTTTVVDQDRRRTEYAYDARGNLLRLTRPDNTTVVTTFDAQDQSTRIMDGNGAVWEREFNARGLPVLQRGPGGEESRYEYDPHGRLAAFLDPLGARTRFSYDDCSRLAAVVDAAGQATRFDYDALGNLTRRQDALGRVTAYEYDGKRRLTRLLAPDASTAFAYDPEDNLVARWGPDGRAARFEYVGLGAMSRSIQPDGHAVSYEYDTEGRLVAVTNQRGESHRFHLDALGQVVGERDYWGQERRYAYTAAGRLEASLDALGQAIRYETDGMGRVLRKLLPKPEVPSGVEVVTFGYDGVGNLVAAENAATRVERRFDPGGRLVSERQGDCWTVDNTYDAAGNLLSSTSRFADDGQEIVRVVRYAYDRLSRMAGMRVDGHPELRIERNALGWATADTLGHGLRRRYTHDPTGRLTSQQVLPTDAPSFGQAYAYDQAGNLVERRDSLLGVDRYVYDAVGFLVEHVAASGQREHYANDPLGNRLRAAAPPGPAGADLGSVRSGEFDASTYHFDRCGSLVARCDAESALRLRWDADQRLVESQRGGCVTTYRYDALGRRISKETDGVSTRFLWNGDRLVGDVLTAGAEEPALLRERAWIYEPGSFVPLAAVEGRSDDAEELFHLAHNDPNGCPVAWLDPQGGVAWAARFTGWGGVEETRPGRPSDAPLRLQGQYADDETGLHYNRFRYFDPRTGQFVSQDPLGLAAGENPYQFAPNVWSWIDPYGLKCDVLFGQMRIGPSFRDVGSGAPDWIRGRELSEVAEDLRAGRLHPDQFPVTFFIHPETGQRIAESNRTLAVLSMAGMEPTKLRETPRTNTLLDRLGEGTLRQKGEKFGMPGPAIPITPGRRDHTILDVVRLP